MKLISYGFTALALLVVCSCTGAKNLEFDTSDAEEIDVTFSINIPGKSKTNKKAHNNIANRLQYAIYDHSSHELRQGSVELNASAYVAYPIKIKDGSVQLTLPLVKGEKYDLFVWADHQDAKGNSPYKIDYKNKIVIVNYDGALANDYTRDAFFYSASEFSASDESTQQVISLTRPLAKIEVATYAPDYSNANRNTNLATYYTEASKSTIKCSYFKVSEAYTQFDLLKGAVVDSSLVRDVVFSPHSWLNEKGSTASVKIPTSGKNATYYDIAQNYLFVKDGNINCVFSYGINDAQFDNNAVDFTNIPVKTNHNTIIYSKFFSKSKKYLVSI